MKKIYEGKARDIYEVDDHKLLIVTTDRLSMHKVLPYKIKNKGIVLNKMTEYWFNKYSSIINNHMITTNISSMPIEFQSDKYKDRCMLVKKVKMFPFEIIVRGYITGTCWKEYIKGNDICGIKLPEGLRLSEKLIEPILTPTTKDDNGEDTNITFDELASMIGVDNAREIERISKKIYLDAHDYLLTKGIILADTKMEFGLDENNNLVLADEILTPDCSRFWNKSTYEIGKTQKSYDREPLKTYIANNGLSEKVVNNIPEDILNQIENRYKEIYYIVTGNKI